VRAAAALVVFVNTLAMALFGLVPGNAIGYPAVTLEVIGILFTAAGIPSIVASPETKGQRLQQLGLVSLLLHARRNRTAWEELAPAADRPAPDLPEQRSSEQAVDLVHFAARHAESLVMFADRVLVRTFEQAVDLAVGIVVQLDLPHAELVGRAFPCSLRDLLNSFSRKFEVIVEIHESRHAVPPDLKQPRK
jgi:hypothetical protein